MKLSKLLVVTMFVAAMLCMASASYAQAPQVVIVGSSGAFNSMALSAINPDPITMAGDPCTGGAGAANFWTNDSVQAVDARSTQTAVPVENGSVWVAWNGDAATIPPGPNPIVCAYQSLDSVLGQRMFFGTNNVGQTGSISISAADPVNPGDGVHCTTGTSVLGKKQVPLIDDSAHTLPCEVWILLNGAQFNAAATDIRPEDALYASSRALNNCAPLGAPNCATDNVKNGLGYGPAPTGQAIISAASGKKFNMFMYGLTGCDPLIANLPAPLGGCNPITQGVELQIGAYPIMIFYNSTVAGGGGGDFTAHPPTDILHEVFATVFGGFSDLPIKIGTLHTCDITGLLGLCSPLNVFNREAASGTFNTAEFQLVRNKGTTLSQELGVNPADNAGSGNVNCGVFGVFPIPAGNNCGNPFKHIFANGATRQRVKGTGEMVEEIGGVTNTPGPPACKTHYGAGFPTGIPNSIGYAFWSFSTYADPCTLANTKYIQLDGVDPLFASYAANPRGAGNWPQCVFNPPPMPPFTCDPIPFSHMVNGDYRSWNIIRLVLKNNYVAPASGPSVPSLLLAAQDQAHSTIPDFVPFVYCTAGGGLCTPAVVNPAQKTGITQPTNVTIGLFAFRSHYRIPTLCVTTTGAPPPGCVNVVFDTGLAIGQNPLNGTNQVVIGGFQPWSENQGDMAGGIFTVQADIDSLADTGAELTAYFQ